MTLPRQNGFRLQEFEVNPAENTIAGPDGKRIVRPAAMQVLAVLAEHSGDFVDAQTLQSLAMPGEPEDPLVLAAFVRELKAFLNDRGNVARLIEFEEDRGYRLLVPVVPLDDYVFETDSGPIHVQPLEGSNSGDFVLQTSSGPVLLHPVADGADVASINLFAELKRRRVFRAIGAYAVAAWLILQIVDVLSGALPVPDWTLTATAVTLGFGFPFAAVFAWVFQLTPAGMVAEGDFRGGDVPIDRHRVVHYFDLVIIAILLVVVAFLSYGRIFPQLQSGDEVRVAVLPFENQSEDVNDSYLSEGISDDIRSRLYDVPQFLVAARSSSRALARRGLDIRLVGERLGVEHVLEGTVRRLGDTIRVSVQLIDVASGFNRWNKSYDTTAAEMQSLQNRISLVVASELKVLLSRELRQILAENVTDDPLAYDLYLQARSYLDRPRSTDNLEHAAALFSEAVAQDPTFALAYAGLCENKSAQFLHSGDTSFVAEAEENCKKGLGLDSGISEIHTALGELYLLSGRLDEAKAAFLEAIALDPRAVNAYSGLGDVLGKQQQPAEAESQYQKAIEILPANWNGYSRYARFLLRQSRFDDSIANYQRAIELAPDNPNGYNNLGVNYYLKGDFQNAAESFRRSLEFAPGRGAYSNTGLMYYLAGDYAEAATLFSRAAEEAETDYRLWGNLADAQRFDSASEDKGEAAYRKAVELALLQLEVNAQDVDTLVNLAWYQVNLGDSDAAGEFLDRALKLPIVAAEQQYLLALIYTRLGDLDSADNALSNARSLGFSQAIIDATPEFQEILFEDQ